MGHSLHPLVQELTEPSQNKSAAEMQAENVELEIALSSETPRTTSFWTYVLLPNDCRMDLHATALFSLV